MSIVYNKLINIFSEREINFYTFKKNKIIGQATWKNIQEGKHIDTRTIDALCKFLNCQPGDILEYVESESLNSEEKQSENNN